MTHNSGGGLLRQATSPISIASMMIAMRLVLATLSALELARHHELRQQAVSISSAIGRATQARQSAHSTASLFVTTSDAIHETLGGPVTESPHRQCWVDPGTGWKDSSAEDIQPWRVVYAQIGVYHRGGVFAHAASAEVVAAADATKARTTPRFLRTHRVKDVFGLPFHPVG